MESGSEDLDDDLVFEETDDEQEQDVGEKMEESSDIMPCTFVGSKHNWWSDNGSSTDLDDLFPQETNDEQEQDVGKKMEESSDTRSRLRRKSNWWSEDECSSDEDYLCCDDLFPKETENEHLADDQEATTSLEGYDIQCSKTIEEKKKGVPSEDILLVDFAAPSSENLVEAPLLATNPTHPVCGRSAAYVHQAGPQGQNGVQNTFSNVVNVRSDEHFPSTTSGVSFQTAQKYQLKEEKPEENIPQIGQETQRLAILKLDLSPVRAADLFVRMCYFLPKGGQIKSVAVYTTEKHGPVGLFDDEFDEVQILASVESHQRYYGVVECDSTDTAKFVYNNFIKIFAYIGVTRKMLELRFIPDSMELSDHLRDIATEEPTTCRGPDLVHLLSAKDMEQIGVVTQHRNPEPLSINAMKLPSRKTIVGVQLKNAVGTYLAAYGNNVSIHRLGEPVYMLAACAGHILWISPILTRVEAMVKEKKWTPENCAVYTNMFLNSHYEPSRSIWDLPNEFNIKKTSCEILFASSIPERRVKDEEYGSQLWSGDCKTVVQHGDNYHNNLVACYGSRAKYVKSLLEVDRSEIASGKMSHKEVLIKLLEAFKSTSEKYEGTGGNIQVYFISRGFDIKLHDGHVNKVIEDVKALKEIIERKKAET